MLTSLLTLKSYLSSKLGQRGAEMVEYALILAFVALIAVAFLDDGGIKDNILAIVDKISGQLQTGQ